MLLAHAVGVLGQAHDLVVAAHLSLCPDCCARSEADTAIGGQLLDAFPPTPLAPDALERALERMETLGSEGDGAAEDTKASNPAAGGFPPALSEMLHAAHPRWLAPGVRQAILLRRADGMLRLLRVRPGKALPRHGHHGTELTLVLEGAFADERGHYGPGDLAEADEGVDHRPVAEGTVDCVCLVATLGRLRFGGMFGGLMGRAAR
jgi:putative transcriptional regulator